MKRIFTAVFTALLFVSMVSCDDEVKQNPKAFTFNVDEFADGGYQSNWAFASNEKGEILGVSQLIAGSSFDMIIEKPYERIDLSFCRFAQNVQSFYDIETYVDVSPGREINVMPQALFYRGGGVLTETGTLRFTVTNFPETDNTFQELHFDTYQGGSATEQSVSGTTVTFAQTMFSNTDKTTLITGTRNGIPVYHRQQNVDGGQNIELDFNDFKPFENLFKIDYPAIVSVNGFNERVPGGHQFYVDFAKDNDADVYHGTVPGFDRYFTKIERTDINSIAYFKFGEPLKSLVPESKFVDFTAQTTDETFENFTASISADYKYKEAWWWRFDDEVVAHWVIRADKDHEARFEFELPEEIRTAFPDAKKEGLRYGGVSYYHELGSYKYADFLDEKLGNKLKDHELMFITIYK